MDLKRTAQPQEQHFGSILATLTSCLPHCPCPPPTGPLPLLHACLPSRLLSWLVGIAEGLAYLHANKIIHRDIRAESIFLTDDDVGVTVVRVEGRVGDEEEGWVGAEEEGRGGGRGGKEGERV